MSLEELEDEALKLDSEARARLARKLLASLGDLTEIESERLWIEEAQRRDAQMDVDPDSGLPADAVFREARSRVK